MPLPIILLILFSFLAVFYLFYKLIKYCRHLCYCPGSGSGGSGSGSGSGCPTGYHSIKLKRLPGNSDIIGKGFHRSGWPYVVNHLYPLHSESGILFDDFVEQNFCYVDKPEIYTEPWVGVFHHPPNMPYFGNRPEKFEVFTKTKEFQESIKMLKLAITLTEFHAVELRKIVDCPVIVIAHPAKQGFPEWSEEEWEANPRKELIQIGFYLRNTQLINQIPIIKNVRKIRLWIDRFWINAYDSRVKKYWNAESTRKNYGEFRDRYFVTPRNFDKMLSKNVVVMEFFTCSATNGLLDCLVRNTPLIVNRHPAVVEYLGEDYPLYFDNPEEIPGLVEQAVEGHRYMKNMNKEFLKPINFINKLLDNL